MRRLELHVRPFEPADAEAVWALHNEALDDAGAHGGNGPWDDDVRDPDSAYRARGGELLVGVLGDELVAMGALRPLSADSAEIKRMRVRPRHQRRGFGTRILRRLEHEALSRGARTLHLDTTTQQRAAQEFYRSHGYREVGRRAAGAFELVLFSKQLPQPGQR